MTNGQQPMQQMPMPQQPVQVKKGLSIAGMICGIVGIVFEIAIAPGENKL